MDYSSTFSLTVEADVHNPVMATKDRNAGSPSSKAKIKPINSREITKAKNESPSPRTRTSRSRSSGSRGSKKSLIRGSSPTGSTSSGSSNPRVDSRSSSPAGDTTLIAKYPYTSTPRQGPDGERTVAGPSKMNDSPCSSRLGRPHSLSQSQISVHSQNSQVSVDESSVSLSLASSGTHTTNSQTDTDPDFSDVAVPIVGYEIMEERARFTIFKIHVQKSSHDNWYIFRRYSDFLRLNDALKELFPHFRLALPPKKWFGDNFDRMFLEDRQLGLQAFLNNIVSHRDVRQSNPVKEFFCFDDPPGPHDSLEESRAQCEMLEEQVYTLKRGLQERDAKITLLEEEINLNKAEIDNLRKALRIERSLNNTRRASPSSRSECSLPEQDQASFTEADQQASETKSCSSVVSQEDSPVTSLDTTSDVTHDQKFGKNRETDNQVSSQSGTRVKTSKPALKIRSQSEKLHPSTRLSGSPSGSPIKKVTLASDALKPVQETCVSNIPTSPYKPVKREKMAQKRTALQE